MYRNCPLAMVRRFELQTALAVAIRTERIVSKRQNVVKSTKLLSPYEAAIILRKSPETLARWRSQMRGPDWIKCEGSVFYRMVDIEHYFVACLRSGATSIHDVNS